MTRLSGEFQTDLSLPNALGACADAVHSLGWQINSLGGDRIVSTAVSDQSGSEATVEIELTEAGEGTDLRITGADSGGLRQPELVDLLEQISDAIEARIEEDDPGDDDQEEEGREAGAETATAAAAAAGGAAAAQEDAPAAEPEAPEEPSWGQANGESGWSRSDADDEQPPEQEQPQEEQPTVVDDREQQPTAAQHREEQAPAGWFADPMGAAGQRYWDGEQWTERRRSGETARTQAEEKNGDSPSWWRQNRRIALVGAFVFLAGGAIGAAATGSGKTTTVGRTATKTVKAQLQTQTQTSTVTETQPSSTTSTTSDTSTTSTTPRSSAGVTPGASGASGGSGGSGPSAPACDPNYKGVCLLPNAKDYDCLGGGGDGPLYTSGPVVIVGDDHYGLDGSDNDGVGCESGSG